MLGPAGVVLNDDGPPLLVFAQDSLLLPRQARTSKAQASHEQMSRLLVSSPWIGYSVLSARKYNAVQLHRVRGQTLQPSPFHPLLLLCPLPLC